MPICNYEKKAKTCLNRLLQRKDISEKNKSDLLKFLNSRIEVSAARQIIISDKLTHLFCKIDDVIGTMHDRDYVNEKMNLLRRELSPGTFENVKSVSKSFVRWFNDAETPKGWRDIRSDSSKQKRKLKHTDMLTWEDGLALADQTNSIQLKAIVLTQLDAGFRPSELIDLNYGDIFQEGKFLIAHVNSGKTGERDVILWKSRPHLEKWLENHPYKTTDSPLWIIENPNNSRKKEIPKRYSYPAIRKRVSKMGSLAGITKPLDFYVFRHSSAVLKKLQNIPVELCAQNMGHSVKHFTQTYGRLSLKDRTRRFERAYGVVETKKDEVNNPIICEICNHVNEPKTEYCLKCKNPLNMIVATREIQKAKEMEEKVKQLESMYEKLALMIGDANKT